MSSPLPAGWERLLPDPSGDGRPPGVEAGQFPITLSQLEAAIARDRRYQVGRTACVAGSRLLECVVVYDAAGTVAVFACDHTEGCTLWARRDRPADAVRLRALAQALVLARGQYAVRLCMLAQALARGQEPDAAPAPPPTGEGAGPAPDPAPPARARVRVPRQPQRLAFWIEVWRIVQGIPGWRGKKTAALLREVSPHLDSAHSKDPRALSDDTLRSIIRAGLDGLLD
jgi:hypothetical protein